MDCGSQVEGHKRCKKRWCPRCAPVIAAERNMRLQGAVEKMRWPLFLTLTQRNTATITPALMRQMRRNFGKLRHRKWWKKNVKGGVATIEITNIGNGWHPHLHAVIDCRWLSVKTTEPQDWSPKGDWKARCELAASEVGAVWAKLCGQELASIKIKRANKHTILKEVVKYALKGSDVADMKGKVGEMIRAMEGTRLMTTFGTVYRVSPEERRLLRNKERSTRLKCDIESGAVTSECPHFNCCPDELMDNPRIHPVMSRESVEREFRERKL